MRAMVLQSSGKPLVAAEVPIPQMTPGEIFVRVSACAVCRTDLHIVDGDLTGATLPLIPGHEIVGRVEKVGSGVEQFSIGDRVGIPWLGWTCGECRFCKSGRENLCDRARFTGYTLDGGYAEFALADARFCFRLPDDYDDVAAAPLLCAGVIGYRSLRKTGDARRLGIYGFGAAAHIVTQVARAEGRQVFAFTRPHDHVAQDFALRLGAAWSGGSDEVPPEKLDAAIVFAPVGALVPAALRAIDKGGIVVCGGIHMSDIPSFPYRDLWEERAICSVANLTRSDAVEFFEIASRIRIHTETDAFALDQANEVLGALRAGTITGAAVLVP
jgi:propanol-preferring alcohol dehydrogenase